MSRFRVTKGWVGKQGAWTAAMLKVIGIEWPPFKGWATALDGVEITEQQRREVERLHRVRLAEREKSAERHASMMREIFWTTPVPGGYRVHREKPKDWDVQPQPPGELF